MKITILGSGTSTGVPEVGCTCPVCTSKDIRDSRLRTSVWVCEDDTRILLDCGPDFRQQMLRLHDFHRIDGVLITHEHYDHVGGLDDLRPFCRFGEIPLYAEAYTAKDLRQRLPYCLVEHIYPGVPRIYLKEVKPGYPFFIGKIEVLPFRVMHGKLPILGYRIGGKLGYITDMLIMPDESYKCLRGIDVLIMNALLILPHPTHQCISEAIKAAERIGARETYLVHMSHHVGLHAEIEHMLPSNIHFAYDGLNLEIAT